MAEHENKPRKNRRDVIKGSLAGSALFASNQMGLSAARAESNPVDTVVINGKVVTPWETLENVTIGIAREKIAFISYKEIATMGKKVIDACGNYILPGLIEPHTHFGAFRAYEDDVLHETKAAAAGGITTVFHYVLGQESVYKRIPYFVQMTEKHATIDMAFHSIAMTEEHLDEIPKCVGHGIISHKFFMAYKGNEMKNVGISGIDLPYLHRGFEQLRNAGGIAMVHAENYDLIKLFEERYKGRNDFLSFNKSRPPICEEIDAYTALRMAEGVGVPLYIVHVSTGNVLNIVKEFRNRGNTVYLETLSRHLVIDEEGKMLKRPYLAKTTPSYKSKADLERLWEGIQNNELDTIGTDSACNTLEQKSRNNNIFSMLPSWQEMPTSLPILLSEGVNKNRITLNQVVKLQCYQPARMFGIYPQKGILQPGSDADLVIVDLNKEQKISHDLFPSACDYTPYEDWNLKGWPVLTMVRGKVVMENGKVSEAAGWGKAVNIT